MKLAKNISYGDGAPLLKAGIVLQDHYIKHLKKLHISAVYIHDNLISNVEIEEVILEETRERAKIQVRTALTELNKHRVKAALKKCSWLKKRYHWF